MNFRTSSGGARGKTGTGCETGHHTATRNPRLPAPTHGDDRRACVFFFPPAAAALSIRPLLGTLQGWEGGGEKGRAERPFVFLLGEGRDQSGRRQRKREETSSFAV
mmetsp:Transcript_11941/g.27264  ORF Transcript_11941/g.27264 Transcript_11941/m.27264 type:complete len:106 (+) Transcript_11941:165-482(+)